MDAAVARVEVMLPTWSARPPLAWPSLSALRSRRLVSLWHRTRRHVLVAMTSVLAGVVMWLPGGFELGLAARMVIGVLTGVGIATIATTISLALTR